MHALIFADLSAPVAGCHADFSNTGSTLAALALFEAMSEVSEERIFAAWQDGSGVTIWEWLRSGKMTMHGHLTSADLEGLRLKIVALANASQWWWSDFEFAVPLSAWVEEHGPAPGVSAGVAGPGVGDPGQVTLFGG